jgi:hypothetical protein
MRGLVNGAARLQWPCVWLGLRSLERLAGCAVMRPGCHTQTPGTQRLERAVQVFQLSAYLFVCLSVCVSVCLPACLSVCLSVCVYGR